MRLWRGQGKITVCLVCVCVCVRVRVCVCVCVCVCVKCLVCCSAYLSLLWKSMNYEAPLYAVLLLHPCWSHIFFPRLSDLKTPSVYVLSPSCERPSFTSIKAAGFGGEGLLASCQT
jgi:hypothetical protein